MSRRRIKKSNGKSFGACRKPSAFFPSRRTNIICIDTTLIAVILAFSLMFLQVAVQAVVASARTKGRDAIVVDTSVGLSPSRRLEQAPDDGRAAEKPGRGKNAVGNGAGLHVSAASEVKRRAYVTLLYSQFIHGTRALGQSLRDSGTSADTVVLVTPDVNQEGRDMLSQDGWIIRPVNVEANPNANFLSRLVFVYTKLVIVEMEDDYDTVVFLDADTLVLSNVDELFFCGPFCAVMRHSELLNSGVLVITPSKKLHREMKAVIGDLDSYTGGDQGFLNSFYPYFAACPAFEPYPTYGSMLAGPSNGPDTLRVRLDGSVEIFGEKRVAADALSWKGSRNARDGDGTRGRGLSRVGGGGQDTRGCKRLPTRYNGDWPLLFVDGDLQMAQGQETSPEAPLDWTRRKTLKIIHFTFGAAKPWDWWAYPFLPFVDLWLEAFYRAQGSGERHARDDYRNGTGEDKRPRWAGVFGQVAWGFSPLFVVALGWMLCTTRTLKRWVFSRLTLRRACNILARWMVPPRALNARSLSGSIFNFVAGLTLALAAAVLAFRAVPASKLGPAYPEAAWAFFWARSTSLVILFYGLYLFFVCSKTKAAMSSRGDSGIIVDYANGDNAKPGTHGTSILSEQRRSAAWPGSENAMRGGSGGRIPAGVFKRILEGSVDTGVGSGVVGAAGRDGGARGIGGLFVVLPEKKAWVETVSHLVCLSAMTISLVTAPLCRGLNGAPASQEILPGIARLLTLLVAFTFSVLRLPTLWAAHAILTYRPKEHAHRKGASRGGGHGEALRRDVSNGHGNSHSSGHTKD